MPRISEFFGIVIYMYFDDHAPPHFHAEYAEHVALIRIDNLKIHKGRLPRGVHADVRKWGKLHRTELEENWELAHQHRQLKPIPPLR